MRPPKCYLHSRGHLGDSAQIAPSLQDPNSGFPWFPRTHLWLRREKRGCLCLGRRTFRGRWTFYSWTLSPSEEISGQLHNYDWAFFQCSVWNIFQSMWRWNPLTRVRDPSGIRTLCSQDESPWSPGRNWRFPRECHSWISLALPHWSSISSTEEVTLSDFQPVMKGDFRTTTDIVGAKMPPVCSIEEITMTSCFW